MSDIQEELQHSCDDPMIVRNSSVLLQRRWLKVAGATGVLAGLLLVGFAARGAGHKESRMEDVPVEAVEATSQLLEVAPPIEKCSNPGELCSTTKCCTLTGYKCFQKNSEWAGCLKSCPPKKGKWSCDRPADLVPYKPSLAPPGSLLYCFEVYLADSGSTKKNWDLSLIRTQLLTHASIFGCEDWEVYSDITTWLTPGPTKLYTIKVEAPHYGKRPKMGTWLNAGVYQNIWAKIKDNGLALRNDWTVKTDADCVWLPSRLRTKLENQEITKNGIYITNCKHVKYGFFGSMAVASKVAVSTYMDNLEDCKAALNWGKWGEDLFEQRCMDLHGVDAVEDFEIVSDGVCDSIEVKLLTKANKKVELPPDCTKPMPAFHPLRNPESYFTCLAATGER